MRFEIVERADEWIVLRDGTELRRFAAQNEALAFVTAELRGLKEGTASLAMRYERRSA
jgi:hypothetical protein